jgi:hypothetical protein
LFGNDSKPTRNWTFKARTPIGGMPAIERQFELAFAYKKEIVRLENERRGLIIEAIRKHHPEVKELEDALEWAKLERDEARKRINQKNQEARARVATDADREAVLEYVRAVWRCRKAVQDFRRARIKDPTAELKKDLDRINAENRQKRKVHRQDAPLYWGTKGYIEHSYRNIGKGAPPDYPEDDGRGGLCVQVQKGLPWAGALLGNDPRVRIQVEPLDARPTVLQRGKPTPEESARLKELRRLRAHGHLTQHGCRELDELLRTIRGRIEDVPLRVADPESSRSRKKMRAIVWFRVDSTPRGAQGQKGNMGKPVWAQIPIVLHRQPPPDAKIKNVYLHRDIVGERELWEVRFALERDAWERETAEDGMCAVHLGWRMTLEGLRVATAVGDDGRVHTLTVPPELIAEWEYAERLQSNRDKEFDAIRCKLMDWMRKHSFPEWLRDATKNLFWWRKSRNIDKLNAIVVDWHEARFKGDASIFHEMERWRGQDKHLHTWQDDQRRKAIERRDDLYRKFATNLALQYHTVKVPDTDYKALKARRKPEEKGKGKEIPKVVKFRMGIASPGRLRSLIREAAAESHKVSAKDASKQCHRCGHVHAKMDPSEGATHTCASCGAIWAVDENTARNLLDREPLPESKGKMADAAS